MPEVVGMLRNIGTGVEPGPAAEYRMDYAAFESRESASIWRR